MGLLLPEKQLFFIIHDPVQREICAAAFEDRIVHHIIFRYLNPIFDHRFIADSYGSRTGKGTHYGIKKILHYIRQCTKNQTTSCRLMKIDLQGFFMNIHKQTLLEIIYKTLITYTPKDFHEKSMPRDLWKWVQQIVLHNPTKNFIIRGTKRDWIGLSHTKSLFKAEVGKGLPLGNLTSQLFANIYLNELDQYIKHILKIQYYGRYMDDMVLIHTDKQVLLDAREAISKFIEKTLHLTLHPKKFYLQQSHKGIPFLGYHIFPRGFILGKRTKKERWAKIRKRNYDNTTDHQEVLQSCNSYLGIARHGKNYHLRKKYIQKLSNKARNKLHSSKNHTKLSTYTKKVKKKRKKYKYTTSFSSA